ncbi:MAG: hypothetical protein ACREVK_03055 [Gammaproteobacteria bacterium]
MHLWRVAGMVPVPGRKDAGGGWQSSPAAAFLRVGTVTGWPIAASGKRPMIELQGEPTRYVSGSTGEPGILNGNGWKPKGMHWRTFERLTAEHDAFVGASLAAMARRLHINIQG